jgi:RNA polymerase sigma factor (sigma-70 family)
MRRKIVREDPVPLIIPDEENIEDTNSETPQKRELSEKIDTSIASLPPKEQLVIKLNLLHDMEYHEISEMLNMPKGTVSSCLKRAKDRLKEELKDF